jgi:hypothetical protein
VSSRDECFSVRFGAQGKRVENQAGAEDLRGGLIDLCGFVGLAPLAWAVVRKAERVHPYGTAIEVQVAFSAGITGVNGLAGRHGGQERSPFVVAALQRRTRKSGCLGGAALADRGGISRRLSIASSP